MNLCVSKPQQLHKVADQAQLSYLTMLSLKEPFSSVMSGVMGVLERVYFNNDRPHSDGIRISSPSRAVSWQHDAAEGTKQHNRNLEQVGNGSNNNTVDQLV